jgi:hypothetical protein
MCLLLHLRKFLKKIFQRIKATYNTNRDIFTNSYVTALNKVFQSMQHSNFAFPSLLHHRYSSLNNNFSLSLNNSLLSPPHSDVLRLFSSSSKSLKYAKGTFFKLLYHAFFDNVKILSPTNALFIRHIKC